MSTHMITTRIAPHGPLTEALFSAAEKGFTGSVTATHAGLGVSTFFKDGEIYAVRCDQYEFPVAALARSLVSQQPPPHEPDPLAWLAGQVEDIDSIDDAVRSWAYGLLSSAFTWPQPVVTKTKNVEVATGRFYRTSWQSVLVDVNQRIDELVESWTHISKVLHDNGRDPLPASVRCTKLAARIEGHALFNGEYPIDELAYAVGRTRHELLRELSRELLVSDREVVLMPQNMSPDLPDYMVPEALEDSENQWASVAVVRARLSLSQESVEQTYEMSLHREESQAQDAAQEALMPLDDDHQDADDDILNLDIEQVIELEPQVQDSEPDTLDELDALVDVDIDTPVHQDEPATLEPSESSNVFNDWVHQATDEEERELRQDIQRRAIEAAGLYVDETLRALDRSMFQLKDEAANLDSARSAEHDAHQQLIRANSLREEAQRQYSDIYTQGQVQLAAQEQAREQHNQAQADRDQAQADLIAAQRALEAAQSRLDSAARAAQEADLAVERTVGEPLAAAQAELERVDNEHYKPAQASVLRVTEELSVIQSQVERLRNLVDTQGRAAARSVEVVRRIDTLGVSDFDSMVGRLEMLLRGEGQLPKEIGSPDSSVDLIDDLNLDD